LRRREWATGLALRVLCAQVIVIIDEKINSVVLEFLGGWPRAAIRFAWAATRLSALARLKHSLSPFARHTFGFKYFASGELLNLSAICANSSSSLPAHFVSICRGHISKTKRTNQPSKR
jgi:hypothetical protein